MSHLAAILPSKGARLEVVSRPTPTPGPNEVLIQVESVALNPVDYFMRQHGFFIENYPAILGSDVAGTIIATGTAVTEEYFKPGTKVAAFATIFYQKGASDYGGFQKAVIVPSVNVVPLPEAISFNEGALLPMAVATAWGGWYSIGVARDTNFTAADKNVILIWGGASSVGSAAVQSAKSMGFDVYVVASEKHHEYMKQLGASKVFDYKSEGVVRKIIQAAKDEGVTIQTCYDAVPNTLESCIEVLKEFQHSGPTRLACAPRVPEVYTKVDGMEVKFCSAPTGFEAMTEHFHFVFNVWLKEKLANGQFVPSPKVKLAEGGLEGLNAALDELMQGAVSGQKIVLEI